MYVCIFKGFYLFDQQIYRSFICWFTSKKATIARAGPGIHINFIGFYRYDYFIISCYSEGALLIFINEYRHKM